MTSRLRPNHVLTIPLPSCTRHFRASPPLASSLPRPNPRILSDLRARLAKCIKFGVSGPEQTRVLCGIAGEVGRDWRDLVAGAEGFLTETRRRGLFRRGVEWGEQCKQFSDIPDQGHVNNVIYQRWAETARIKWASNYAKHIDPTHEREWSELWTSRGDGFILKSIFVDFKFPVKFPDSVTVYHKLRTLPHEDDASFKLDVLILSERHQRPAARCEEDIMLYDYRKGSKIGLGTKPFMLKAFQETFRLQEEAAAANARRCGGLLERVRALEKATWDREGAVEDLGSATP
ncbi:MAG: hypothetical protein M1828_000095 [Chrysothrix sp. TS-e1954]|nr:MAG: hypothetical protein M1828_000095 [Chrysothrix sp. TS-e1954]